MSVKSTYTCLVQFENYSSGFVSVTASNRAEAEMLFDKFRVCVSGDNVLHIRNFSPQSIKLSIPSDFPKPYYGEVYSAAIPHDLDAVAREHVQSDKDGLLKRFYEEMNTICDGQFEFSLNITAMMSLIGSVQLALRHPRFSGASADMAKSFVLDCKKSLSAYPSICEVIDKGFERKYDE